MLTQPEIIVPEWPVPGNVRAVITTRQTSICADVSAAPYANFNLGFHVGDDTGVVQKNWQTLQRSVNLPEIPILASQVHGNRIVDREGIQPGVEADGVYTNQPNRCCSILTADCLPVLLCNRRGDEVAALHAGWRGLASGVIQEGIRRFESKPEDVFAYLGPCIGPLSFEVGEDVRNCFLEQFVAVAKEEEIVGCFSAASSKGWLADLPQLAGLVLRKMGVAQIFDEGYCTFSDATRFYSYRRDGVTGRIASIIWFE